MTQKPLRSLAFSTLLLLTLLITPEVQAQVQHSRYEFRAVWIATVDNIDWPSRKGLPSAEQKREFIRQLDMHKANGMNAVIMQIRPAADAFYPSPYEPWSEWLTGVQGKAPSPYYDPLMFMIEEVHKRGMEFHAWCNPYRAVFTLGASSVSPKHITRQKPGWFINYGDKKYFDPGNKEVQAYVNRIVEDIVTRYDIDAIHFDDYFYPYRIPGKFFNDDKTFRLYGNGMARDDWRRSNVDSVIRQLNQTIKKVKPWCRFGISPFGVWRNSDKDSVGSKTRAGQTNYDDLYADILLWLRNDWIDYVAPQLYWEFGHQAAAYETLLSWWNEHSYGKDCYIGLGIYKANTSKPWKDPGLLPKQIAELRTQPNIHGAIYFSSTSFVKNPLGWNDSLRQNYYRYPALIAPRSDQAIPLPPQPQFGHISYPSDQTISIQLNTPESHSRDIRLIAIYQLVGDRADPKKDLLLDVKTFSRQQSIEIIREGSEQNYYLTFTNRLNQESNPSVIIRSNGAAAKR